MKKFLFALVITGVLLSGCGSDTKEEMANVAESMESISISDVDRKSVV